MTLTTHQRTRSYLPNTVMAAIVMSLSTLSAGTQAEPNIERLFFASDVHDSTSNLQSLVSAYGSYCEFSGLVGDYEVSLDTIQSILPGSSKVLTQGNHGSSTVSTGPVTLTSNGNYDVYALNFSDFTASGNTALHDYLRLRATGKTLFVMSHIPLHPAWVESGTGKDVPVAGARATAQAIFNTLNEYGSLYSIVFLWGHNHRHATYDTNVKMIAKPGEKISDGATHSELLSGVVNTTLNFSYVNAGYVLPITGTPASASVVTLAPGYIWIDRYGNRPSPDSVSYDILGALWEGANSGAVPYNAYEAGYDDDGTPLYACRARYQNGFFPGKIRSSYGGCKVSLSGAEANVTTYEVLTLAATTIWQSASGGNIPAGSTPCGLNESDQFLYACRANYGSGVHIGKTRTGLTTCKFAYNGTEKTASTFEVLKIQL